VKRVFIAILMLAFTTAANAGIWFYVNGCEPPDKVISYPSEVSVLSIWSDGQIEMDMFYMGTITMYGNPGSLNIDDVIIPSGWEIYWIYDPDLAGILGVNMPFVGIENTDVPPPPEPPIQGLFVDNILFHPEDLGTTDVALFDQDGVLLDRVRIWHYPEPATIFLLAVGGLMLRRRK
jgi:hypothetical protein